MIRKSRIGLLAIAVLLLASVTACGRKNPKQPSTQGIVWQTNLHEAQQMAKQSQKIILMEFTAEWCPWCKMLEDSTFSERSVQEKINAFVPVKIDVEKQKAVADRYDANARKYGGMGIPNMLFLSPDGKRLKHAMGYRDPKSFVALLDSVLTGYIK